MAGRHARLTALFAGLALPAFTMVAVIQVLGPAVAVAAETPSKAAPPPPANPPPANPPSAKPATGSPKAATPQAAAPPTIETDPSKLPPAVARMRDAILDAARTGDAEKLRLALERNEVPPLLVKGQKGDPIAGLKGRSGDGEGRETMGLLIDLLEAPYVHIKPGTAEEMYVWPWFAEYAPGSLDPEQIVEIYRILRAAEFKDSLAKGKYLSWRLGIGPDGTWHYFLTGE